MFVKLPLALWQNSCSEIFFSLESTCARCILKLYVFLNIPLSINQTPYSFMSKDLVVTDVCEGLLLTGKVKKK
jgi:hypothetical protein